MPKPNVDTDVIAADAAGDLGADGSAAIGRRNLIARD